METTRNEAYLLLESGKILTNTGRLIGLARECDCEIGREKNEGTEVKYRGRILTVVPRHREINRNTAKGIMRAIANYQSSFRQYQTA